jgi:hypothetical protein
VVSRRCSPVLCPKPDAPNPDWPVEDTERVHAVAVVFPEQSAWWKAGLRPRSAPRPPGRCRGGVVERRALLALVSAATIVSGIAAVAQLAVAVAVA